METGPFQRIFDEITNKRIDLLVEVIREGGEASSECAGYLLSLIPTKRAAEEVIKLIEETADVDMMYSLTAAFVAHSPFRDEMRPALETIFADEENSTLEVFYAEIQELDPRLLALPDRAREIATALEKQFIQNLHKADREFVLI